MRNITKVLLLFLTLSLIHSCTKEPQTEKYSEEEIIELQAEIVKLRKDIDSAFGKFKIGEVIKVSPEIEQKITRFNEVLEILEQLDRLPASLFETQNTKGSDQYWYCWCYDCGWQWSAFICPDCPYPRGCIHCGGNIARVLKYKYPDEQEAE